MNLKNKITPFYQINVKKILAVISSILRDTIIENSLAARKVTKRLLATPAREIV